MHTDVFSSCDINKEWMLNKSLNSLRFTIIYYLISNMLISKKKTLKDLRESQR